jgi:hypothetical protein
MTHEKTRLLIRRICVVLWILIVGWLSYQNHLLRTRIRNLEQFEAQMSETNYYLSDSTEKDAIAVELAALTAENATYRANLRRQGTNLKECMAKLPQNEIDDFYRRHREELLRALAK